MVWLVLGIGLLAMLLALLLSQTARKQTLAICNFALEQSVHKQKNIDAILKLFEGQDKFSNEEIRESLGVTRRSVARYMDILEKAGQVKQIGDSGRFVTYSLNP